MKRALILISSTALLCAGCGNGDIDFFDVEPNGNNDQSGAPDESPDASSDEPVGDDEPGEAPSDDPGNDPDDRPVDPADPVDPPADDNPPIPSECFPSDHVFDATGPLSGVGDLSEPPPGLPSCGGALLEDDFDGPDSALSTPTLPLSGGVDGGDEDWFELQAKDCELIEARIAIESGSDTIGVELYDADGTMLSIGKRVGDWIYVAYHHPVAATETYRLRVASENGCEPYVLTQLEASAPNPALEISSRRTEGVAPAGMIFTVESRGFAAARSFHDVHYTWTFDDPGEHTQLSSDYPWAPDANLAYGPVASHTFTKPGTYAVRVVATDGVIRAVREVDVTVLDPDVVFAGSDTVAISQNGDFTGAPAGATEVTSVPAALAAAGSNVRILFRAGEVFEQGLGKINAERLSVGAFGLGDPPVLHDQIVDNEDVTGESSVWGLFVQGDYDASDPFNSPSRGPGGVRVANKNHTTVHDCRFDGIVTAFRNGETENLVVSNVRAENWSDYGMLLGDGGWVSFHGVAFRQHPRAINGQGKGNITADHGPIRISRPTGPVSFHLIDFFSNVSWFNNSSVQNVIRWNTGGLEQAQDLVLDRARTEGGSVFGGQNNGGLAHRMRVVVDKFHHISSYSPASLLTLGHPGSTVRNAIVVIPDVAPLSSTGTRYAFSFEAGSASPAEGVYPKELYSCTIVDLRSPSNATNGSGSSTRDFQPYNGGSGQNCVTYAPRIGGGTTSDGPLDLSPRWTPRNPGRSVENEPFDPSYATPSESAAIFQPEGESPAIESALRTLNVAYDDFFGRRRGAKPSRGAVEP